MSFGPDLSIDGLINDRFYHTKNKNSDEWLQIDMGTEENLARVGLHFRRDGLRVRRAVKVRFGNILASENSDGNPECVTLSPPPAENYGTFACGSTMTGQYLVVKSAVNEYFEISEIFAYSV